MTNIKHTMYMRRLLIFFTFLTGFLSASAQTGLKVNDLFQGRIIPQERLVETRVRGKTLEKYQLSYYRSLRFTATEAETARLRQLVEDDARGHFASVSGKNHSYTYKVQASPQNGKNRFLCYREDWTGRDSDHEVTVIYMEGTVGSLGELEELLNK